MYYNTEFLSESWKTTRAQPIPRNRSKTQQTNCDSVRNEQGPREDNYLSDSKIFLANHIYDCTVYAIFNRMGQAKLPSCGLKSIHEEDFISRRRLRMVKNKHISNPNKMNTSVTEGSAIVPRFFLNYFDDLHNLMHCFVDDSTLHSIMLWNQPVGVTLQSG